MKKIIFASALCALTLTACQEEDFDVNKQDIFKASYDQNFVNKYGNIDPDQDWDISTRGGSADEYERVAPEGEYYEVPSAIINHFQDYFPEGGENKDKVKAFTLTTSKETTFEIIPIYQGGAYYDWAISMFVNGEEQLLWDKGQYDIQFKGTRSYTEWWQTKYETYNDWTTFDESSDPTGNADYLNVSCQIRSKSILVTVPADANIYFQIANKSYPQNSRHPYTKYNTSIAETPYVGLIEDCPKPDLNDDYEVNIVTFEGYDYTDGDFNDAAFMLVGYSLPDPVYEDEEVTLVENQKRFMIEDCGSSIDWDFNDVVIDTWSEHTAIWTINTTTGERTIKEDKGTKVFAKVSHLCGTYPVRVCFGAKEVLTFSITDPTNKEQTLAELNGDDRSYSAATGGKGANWNPDVVQDITWTGFDPTSTAVVVYTYKNFDLTSDPVNSDGVAVSKIEKGAVPTILCTKQTDAWTAEGQDIAEMDWWQYFGM